MSLITNVYAREVLTSRGEPTIEVEVTAEGITERAIVPSGASTGTHEALELRDGDAKRYLGKGVLKAVENVNTIIKDAIIGRDVFDQRGMDDFLRTLDGTPNKSNLGANAILGVSMAVMRVAARIADRPLYAYISILSEMDPSHYEMPRPMMNVINGGMHADSGLSIQEFMIVPMAAPSVKEAVRMGAEVFQHLKKLLASQGHAVGVGDEGGFAPHLGSHEKALDILVEAITKAGYAPGKDIALALDAAASEFYKDGKYHILVNGELQVLSSEELSSYYGSLIERYPIISIEDSHAEDDFVGFKDMHIRFGKQIQLVGDDLYVTNTTRITTGIKEDLSNAVLIKMNQIGTISETLDAIRMTQQVGWKPVISHRSGETEDTTIADLCVGTHAGQIKTGSLSRSERIAKYNQLIRIEDEFAKEWE